MSFKASSQIPTSQALYEIAFAPEMLPHRIEKERKAPARRDWDGSIHYCKYRHYDQSIWYIHYYCHNLSIIILMNP